MALIIVPGSSSRSFHWASERNPPRKSAIEERRVERGRERDWIAGSKWILFQWISTRLDLGLESDSSFFSLYERRNQRTPDKFLPLFQFRNLLIWYSGTDITDFKIFLRNLSRGRIVTLLFFNPRIAFFEPPDYSPFLSPSISSYMKWRTLSWSGFHRTQRLSRGPLSSGSWTGRVHRGKERQTGGLAGPGFYGKSLRYIFTSGAIKAVGVPLVRPFVRSFVRRLPHFLVVWTAFDPYCRIFFESNTDG